MERRNNLWIKWEGIDLQFVNIAKKHGHFIGIRTEQGIIDLEAAVQVIPPREQIVLDPMHLIGAESHTLAALRSYLEQLSNEKVTSDYLLEESTVKYGPCVPRPGKIICVGLNYGKHADESNLPHPKMPILFSKFNNSLNAHLQEVQIPATTHELDYEVELGIVIGSNAKNVNEEDALDYVFGYCTANDISARDLQMRTSQWLLGKTSDGFCPVGPYLVTADEIVDPQNLELRTYVNGELRQNSNTEDMIFNCAHIISYISHHLTLEPGDLILTGTPEGVIMGQPVDQRVYLKPGDVVSVEVEGLGRLTNTMK